MQIWFYQKTEYFLLLGGYCLPCATPKKRKRCFHVSLLHWNLFHFHTPHITFRKCERKILYIEKYFFLAQFNLLFLVEKHIMSRVSKRDMVMYIEKKDWIPVFSFLFLFFGINKTIYWKNWCKKFFHISSLCR
jgi:hypothetical protein